MRKRLTVRVPATTGNLGPGFDCLGMALDIWNTIEIELGRHGLEVLGEGEASLPRDRSNMIYRCFRTVFDTAGQPVPQAYITCRNQIPLARGLGSSSAAVVAGLVAGNEMCQTLLAPERLLDLAAEIEGHPDNVAPALLGGCQIVVQREEHLISASIEIPKDLNAVLYIPNLPMPTEQARRLLRCQVDRQDAVYNMGRVALLIRALTVGDLAHLSVATEDRLHQPARQTIFPAMKNIISAAMAAGALGAFLSGAGSTVLALTRGREFTVGSEMADAASKSGIDGTVRITRPTNQGAYIMK